MASLRLSRRAMLTGLGGVAVALPWLEAMESRPAFGQTRPGAPRRYVVMFGGTSTGRQGRDLVRPATTGAGWASNTALAPIDTRGVRGDVGVVTNLFIPVGGAGGRPAAWHASSVGPLLSGVSATDASPAARGPTSEQIVAARLLAGVPMEMRPRVDTVTWRVQAESYRGGEGAKGLMSAKRNASGALQLVAPIASPQVIFRSLFGGGTATGGSTAAALAAARHRSVLDLVRTRAGALMGRVGSADRVRLQRHFDELRDLERSVAALGMTSGAACRAATDPGADPTVNRISETISAGRIIGYADEARRAEVLVEMLYLALACNMTWTASLMLTYSQTFMNAAPLLGGLPMGAQLDVHECGHTGLLGSAAMQDVMARCVAWHVDVFARLVRRLKDTPDGDGTLLDHTAVSLVFEGGVGYDPESGDNGVSHSSENMSALYAGARMRGAGQHIDGARAHPARVLLSAMRAVGVADPLGELRDPLPALAAV